MFWEAFGVGRAQRGLRDHDLVHKLPADVVVALLRVAQPAFTARRMFRLETARVPRDLADRTHVALLQLYRRGLAEPTNERHGDFWLSAEGFDVLSRALDRAAAEGRELPLLTYDPPATAAAETCNEDPRSWFERYLGAERPVDGAVVPLERNRRDRA